jgi:hypothetical protein
VTIQEKDVQTRRFSRFSNETHRMCSSYTTPRLSSAPQFSFLNGWSHAVLSFMIVGFSCTPQAPEEHIVTIAATTSNQYVLRTTRPRMAFSHVWLSVTGELSGNAVMRVEGYAPIALSNNVAFAQSFDWFSSNCPVTYMPLNVVTGRLELRYRFH